MEIPQGVSLGDPVGAEVFAVAVAAEGIVAAAADLVDLADIVRHQKVVRVENKKSIVAVKAAVAVDLFQQKVQGVALADLRFVVAAKDLSATGPGHLCCSVGAVVGYHKGGDQLRRVILGPDGFQQMGKDCFFVPGGDENRIAAALPGLKGTLALDQREDQVHDLVEIANRGHHSQSIAKAAEDGQ